MSGCLGETNTPFGALYQSAGVNLPKGEGKLYSRFYRDPAVMDTLGSVVLFNIARAHLVNRTSGALIVCVCVRKIVTAGALMVRICVCVGEEMI